jgi:type IV pilus assembly protein PilV
LACSAGIVLIETLVALLIFSFGILALLAVQGSAQKAVMAAKGRADAGNLADQIIGQIWADRANIANYAHYPNGSTPCSPTGNPSSNQNVSNWLSQVSATLPNASAASQQISIGTSNTISVTICWKYPQEATTHSYSTMAQING